MPTVPGVPGIDPIVMLAAVAGGIAGTGKVAVFPLTLVAATVVVPPGVRVTVMVGTDPAAVLLVTLALDGARVTVILEAGVTGEPAGVAGQVKTTEPANSVIP